MLYVIYIAIHIYYGHIGIYSYGHIYIAMYIIYIAIYLYAIYTYVYVYIACTHTCLKCIIISESAFRVLEYNSKPSKDIRDTHLSI